MSKKYVRIDHGWGDQLLIPLELVSQLVESGYVVSATGSAIDKVEKITKLVIHEENELQQALVQNSLEGK
jgi:hypothetical protein